jgi:hypothetical protein
MAAPNSWCSTNAPTAEHLSAIQSLHASDSVGNGLHRRQNSTEVNVPVYITAVVNTTNSDDVLSEAVLEKQFDVIVDRFAPYDISFTLQNVTRLIDDDNAQGFSFGGWNGFKFAQRKGDYGTLNLYYVSNMADDPWGSGSCTLPSEAGASDPINGKLDGCTLQAYTAPGGTDNDGKEYIGEIAVHEIGHWLSLLHTFDGQSCTGPGVS